MSKTINNSKSGLTFKQGLQLFFVRKILDERYTMGSLVGTERGNEFFRQWSKIVCNGRKKDKDFPCSIRIPKEFGKVTTEDGREIEGSLDAEVKKTRKKVQDVKSGLELVIKAGTHGEAYRPMVENPRFSGLFHLLGDEDLGHLMQIPYPTEAQVAEIAAVVGTSKDEDRIREVIARYRGKKPDALNEDDYSEIIELDLNRSGISDLKPIKELSSSQLLYLRGTQIRDIETIMGFKSMQGLDLSNTQVRNLEPIKGLRNLQFLYLRGTQVSDLEPIKGLSNLELLDLSDTKVGNLEHIEELSSLKLLVLVKTKIADEQVKELRKALPKVQIIR